MNIIFVRHAETEGNITGLVQGPEHRGFTKKGLEEARTISEKLKGEHFSLAY